MRRFLHLPLQDNFINKRMCLLEIPLKMSALLKQVPLFVQHVSVTSLLQVRTWCMVICVH